MSARRILGVVSVAALVAVLLALAPALGLIPTTSSDPDDSQALFSVTPCSVFDSRPNQGGTGKFAANETRAATLEGTAACPDVPTEATGFLISIIAIGAEGLGSVKAWPAAEAEPAAGGVLAFSAAEFAPANTIFVADGGDPDDISVKVLSSPAHVKIVLLGYSLDGTAVYESLDRTIVVPAGGTDVENGTALTDAIATAAAAAPTAEDPVTVLLQPGRYDLGGEVGVPRPDVPLALPSFVDLVGPGAEMTLVKCVCAGATVAIDGTNTLKGMRLDNSLVFTPGIIVEEDATLVVDDIATKFNGLAIEGTGNDGIVLDVLNSTFDQNGNLATIRVGVATVRIDNSHFDAAAVETLGGSIVMTDSTVDAGNFPIVQFRGEAVLDGVDISVGGSGRVINGLQPADLIVRNSRLDNSAAGVANPTIQVTKFSGTNTVLVENSVVLAPPGGDVYSFAFTGNVEVTFNNNTLHGTVDTDEDITATCTGTAKADGTFLTTGCP